MNHINIINNINQMEDHEFEFDEEILEDELDLPISNDNKNLF